MRYSVAWQVDSYYEYLYLIKHNIAKMPLMQFAIDNNLISEKKYYYLTPLKKILI